MLNVDAIKSDAEWLGLTHASLAKASGVSAVTISKLFTGRRRLTLGVARLLVAAIVKVKTQRQAMSRMQFTRVA